MPTNQQKYFDLIREYISFKSISTDPQYKDQIKATVNWLKDLFEKHQFDVTVYEGYGNPVILASYTVDPEAKTVLVYGHYDVQPANIEDGWDKDPFELNDTGAKLIARGIVDNKGQHLIHVATVLALIEENRLKYNVKFLIEGDEETGGVGLSQLLKDKMKDFEADYTLASDGEIPYKPMVTSSYRGVFNMSIKYKTANNNLHSGLYGGAVPNAGEELMRLLTKLHNTDYSVAIPNFYEGQDQISKSDLDNSRTIDKVKSSTLEKTGIKKFFNRVGDSFTATVGFETMITVTGFSTGYTGEGFSNIVPATAEAKINVRIAPSQTPQQVTQKIIEFVKSETPDYVEAEISDIFSAVEPVRTDVNTPEYQEVLKLLEDVYGEKPLVDYCGATLPVIGDFKKILKVIPLDVPLGNDDCNMHGVNENFDKELLSKGLEFSKRFFGK